MKDEEGNQQPSLDKNILEGSETIENTELLSGS
jgi:hypothetical protein